jgi:hypothetical protein
LGGEDMFEKEYRENEEGKKERGEERKQKR